VAATWPEDAVGAVVEVVVEVDREDEDEAFEPLEVAPPREPETVVLTTDVRSASARAAADAA